MNCAFRENDSSWESLPCENKKRKIHKKRYYTQFSNNQMSREFHAVEILKQLCTLWDVFCSLFIVELDGYVYMVRRIEASVNLRTIATIYNLNMHHKTRIYISYYDFIRSFIKFLIISLFIFNFCIFIFIFNS